MQPISQSLLFTNKMLSFKLNAFVLSKLFDKPLWFDTQTQKINNLNIAMHIERQEALSNTANPQQQMYIA